jgi:Zn-dependent peptidase ImmA (M78 family)
LARKVRRNTKRYVRSLYEKTYSKIRNKELEKKLFNWAKKNPFVRGMFEKYGLDFNKELKRLKIYVIDEDDSEFERLVGGGTYGLGEIELLIGAKAPKQRILHSLVHELAHHVYLNMGPLRERLKRWWKVQLEIKRLPWHKRKVEQFALAWEILFLRYYGFPVSKIKQEFRYEKQRSTYKEVKRYFNVSKFVDDVFSGKYNELLEKGA